MTGSYDVIVSNSRLQYKFKINRNITITKDTKQRYSKSELNPYYLTPQIKNSILEAIKKDNPNLPDMVIF